MSEDKIIIYILIGTGNKPLASYSQYTGEFIQNCEQHLAEVKPNSSAAINCNDYFIFYINENRITYLLMTGTTFPKATAVGCLDSLKKEFANDLIGQNFNNVRPYGLSEQYKDKLQMKFDYFNEHTEVTSESLQNLKNEIMKMSDEVHKACNDLRERGEKVGQLNAKSEELKDASSSFKQGAIRVRKKTTGRKVCVIVGIIVALLIIIYFIICLVCHSWTFKCGGDE